MTDGKNPIDYLKDLDASGLVAELAGDRPGLTTGEAREALAELMAADPDAAATARERFLGWESERQSEALDALAGADPSERRSWSRLLCGIREAPDGLADLAAPQGR